MPSTQREQISQQARALQPDPEEADLPSSHHPSGFLWKQEHLRVYFSQGGAVSSFRCLGDYSFGITNPRNNFKAGKVCLKHLPTLLFALSCFFFLPCSNPPPEVQSSKTSPRASHQGVIFRQHHSSFSLYTLSIHQHFHCLSVMDFSLMRAI